MPAACLDYDPMAPEVAQMLSELIRSKSAELAGAVSSTLDGLSGEEISGSTELGVEHIGSTSVPGCAGKGVIDLMLLYPEGGLEQAKRVLDSLGFQRQQTRDPFPESRPMRLAGIGYKGIQYRLHVHVISFTSSEAAELRGFRDALSGDPELRQSYVERKRAIIAAGFVDSVDYSEAKGEFISHLIQNRLSGKESSAGASDMVFGIAGPELG
jgi:GrpB-like predicted nucleotidyltransferase (UPF0157 family)